MPLNPRLTMLDYRRIIPFISIRQREYHNSMIINRDFICGIAVLLLVLLSVSGQRFYLTSNTTTPAGFTSFSSVNWKLLGHAQIFFNVLRLNNLNTLGRGSAIYPQPVTAHLGFRSVFGWTSSRCARTTPDPSVDYADGIQFIMTGSPIASISTSYEYDLGTRYLDYLFSVGYSTSFNEFNVCDWDSYSSFPNVASALTIRTRCRIIPNSGPRLVPGSHTFVVEYDPTSDLVTMDVDGARVVNHTMSRKLPAYQRNLALNVGDAMSCNQDITLWTWESRIVVTEFSQLSERISTIGNAYVDVPTNRLYLTNGTNSVGLAALRDSMIVLNQHYVMNFKWTVLGSQINQDVDGFSLFFTKTRPERTVDSLTMGSGLGIQSRPDMAMIGYNRLLNEFYVCKWTTPITGLLRDNCTVFQNTLPSIPSNRTLSFEITYNEDIFRLVVDNRLLLTAQLEMDKSNELSIGFTGSTSSAAVTQYISDWTFSSSMQTTTNTEWAVSNANFAAVQNTYRLIGYSSLQSSTSVLTLNAPRSQLPALANGNSTGGIIYKTTFAANIGFYSTLTYSHFVTTQTNGGCYDVTKNDGLTVFVTSDPAVLSLGNMSYSDLGLTKLRNVITMTFWNRADFTGQKITFCKWDKYEVANPGDFRDTPLYCSTRDTGTASCLSGVFNFTLEVAYNAPSLAVAVNGYSTGNVPMRIAPSTSGYYMGIISADKGTTSAYKTLNKWTLDFSTGQNIKSSFSLVDNPRTITSLGAASVSTNQVIVTSGGVAAVMHKTSLPVHLGIQSSFSWRPTNCSDDAGFTFFLTNTARVDATIGSNYTESGYGTSLLSGVTSITYIAAENSFVAYFNSTPEATIISLQSQASETCGTFMDVSITFDGFEIHVFLDNQLAVSFTDPAKVFINPGYYYIGLSSTEGTITQWNFTTLTQPSKRQTVNVIPSVTTLGTASVVGTALRLTTGGSESGVGYYPQAVHAHLGFTNSFTWTPTNCDTTYNGADGFAVFLSKEPPQYSDVYASSGGLLGVASIPNVYMFGYSAVFNEFYVCNWTTPLGANFRSACSFITALPSRMSCGPPLGYSLIYEFTGREFRLHGNFPAFTVPLIMDPVPYFVGLSGGTGGGYFQQDVKDWRFDGTPVQL